MSTGLLGAVIVYISSCLFLVDISEGECGDAWRALATSTAASEEKQRESPERR